jgi:hypothetical protein
MKKTVTKKRVDDVEEPSSRVPPNHLATGISTQVIDYADTIKENLLVSTMLCKLNNKNNVYYNIIAKQSPNDSQSSFRYQREQTIPNRYLRQR